MKKKNVPTLTVIAVSAGLLTLSAVSVPVIAASTRVANHAEISPTQSSVLLAATSVASKTPLLNISDKAQVSTVEEYLEQTMTEEEIQQIYAYADKSTNLIESSTRKMSAQEQKKLQALREQYTYEGVRPEKLLPLKAGVASFYLDMDKDTFVYPKRELTNEELLQYIDWIARLNFALGKRYVAPQPDAKDIKKEEAVKKARESVKKLFDVDVEGLEMNASYNKLGPAQQGFWSVHFQPSKAETLQSSGKTYMMYIVLIDSLSGVVIDTTIFHSTYKRTPITNVIAKNVMKDQSWTETAKTIVVKKQGEKRAIKKTSIIQEAQYDQRGTVAVSVELEDGSSYIAELRYPDKTLRCLIYQPAKSGK